MINYRPLWITLAERSLSKAEFKEVAGISSATLTKLNKNNYVSLEIVDRICETMNINVDKVIEIKRGDKE